MGRFPLLISRFQVRFLDGSPIKSITYSHPTRPRYLCFAKIQADRSWESPGVSRRSCRLSLHAKSNRTPGAEAPEPACAGRMFLQHSPGMVGTAVWEQRLCGTGIVGLQQRATGITPRASRSDGEDRRLRGSRSPFLYLVAALSEAPARPCPTPSASSIRERIHEPARLGFAQE